MADETPTTDLRVKRKQDRAEQIKESVKAKASSLKEQRDARQRSATATALKKLQKLKQGDVDRKKALKSLQSAAKGSTIDVDDVATDGNRSEAIADRARQAGEARAPVDVSLDMQGDPRAMEAFATADPGDIAAASPDGLADDGSDMSMEALVLGGIGVGVDGNETDDNGGLSFDDPLGVAVGFGMDDGDDESPGWF